MSSPTQVAVMSRFSIEPAIFVDWHPTDTLYDILERAGLNPDHIVGVIVDSHYIRSLRSVHAWPNSTIEVDHL